MCPIPATRDQFVYWMDVKMYRERISISETAACWLLFVFLVTRVASFVAEDARASGWCEDPGQTCSRCLESHAVRCSGIANARLRGDLCGCCASCVVDRALGESCGSQLSVRPLNIVDSWTAVLATSWCHSGLVCIDFVCQNLTVNEEPTVLTTRASVAVVQQIQESRISIGSLEDSSFVGEDDRANFLLGENVTPPFYRQANHDNVHTTERARSDEEARSNARFWTKLRTGLRKSQQETLTDVEASAYSATMNFIALTSPLGTRVMREDDEMNDSEIGIALERKKLKAVTKTLRSLGDGTTERMPKSDLAVSIRQRKPQQRCAVTEHLDNSTTIRIGNREFRIMHGMDSMSDLRVLLGAIDHSEFDSSRGDWTVLDTVSLLIDSVRDRCIEPSGDNELVGEPALSADWKDRSSHPFRQIFKTVREVPYDPTSQESSVTTEDGQESSTSFTVTNVTENGQEASTSPTATNVTSSVLEGDSRSSTKRPKRSRRGLEEIDEDDYETNESVLRFDSLKNVEQLLSRDVQDHKSYEDSASPGIHSSDQVVSSLYDEVYGEYPEDLVIFFDNDNSQNRSTSSVDIGRSLTKVTDRGRGSGVTKRMPPLAEKQNVSGDLNAFRAIGNSPTSDDGRSSNGIPAHRIPKTPPKLGEARRVNATSLAIDDLFNRIETRMDGLERRIEGSVLKGCETLRSQGLQDSREVRSGRSRLESEEVESRHEVPINESRSKMLKRGENVTSNGVAKERNRTEIRRFGNRRRMGNHSNDRTKTILRSDLPDEEFVADGYQRKRGRLIQDSAEATLWNSTAQNHRHPMYARRRPSTRWRHPEDERRPFHEQISAEGVGRLEYPDKNGRQHRESLGDRGSRRVVRHSIWSPKALRSLPVAMNDDGPKTSRFCGQTQEIPGQGSTDDYPQAPTTLEILSLESPSTYEAEALDSKRVVSPPWRLFVSGTNGPDDRAKISEEPAESRGQNSQRLHYAVTSRGNSSIRIEDAISGEQYEDSHDDDEDFDHMYESVEANDDEDWTMMASVDSLDRIDYFDGIGSHMAPVLLEIYGSPDITESDESGIHPEFAGIASMSGRTSRSASEDTVSFPNLHSPSDGKGSFGSPTPLVPPQRQKTRDPISRIWNSVSTAELAASHRQPTSSTTNFFQAIDA